VLGLSAGFKLFILVEIFFTDGVVHRERRKRGWCKTGFLIQEGCQQQQIPFLNVLN
jgi:hypothetical protein